MATCQSMKTDASGNDIEVFDAYHWFKDGGRWREGYDNSGTDEVANYLLFQNTIPNASAVLLRGNLVQGGLRAPEDMRIAGDWSFWVSILLQSDICHVGEPLNHFRQAHADSQRVRTAVSGEEILEAMRVNEQIGQGVHLVDSRSLFAQSGLMRRWLTVSIQHGIACPGQRQIYARFMAVRFKSILYKIAHAVMASLALILMPFTRIPGAESLANWLQNLFSRRQ
jgi:hypothetical protein